MILSFSLLYYFWLTESSPGMLEFLESLSSYATTTCEDFNEWISEMDEMSGSEVDYLKSESTLSYLGGDNYMRLQELMTSLMLYVQRVITRQWQSKNSPTNGKWSPLSFFFLYCL